MPKELRTNLVEESESAESESAAAEHRNAHEDIEHLQQQATQRQHAQVPACIVHAFLHCLPTTEHQPASIVTRILEDDERMSSVSLTAIANVFECAFIWYTDPRGRTEFVHRDTDSFVREWHQLAKFRESVGADRYFNGTYMPPEQRQTVFQAYLQKFASTGLRPGQDRKRMKSYAEAHLRDIAANKMIAFVIWEVGVPKVTPAAEQNADTIETDTIAILNWLDAAAICILQYKQTTNYLEALRRAGTSRCTSGITIEEQAQRAELRRAQANVRKGHLLAQCWSRNAITFSTMTLSDWALLQNHWCGANQQRLLEIQKQRGDLRITMPPLRSDLPQSQ